MNHKLSYICYSFRRWWVGYLVGPLAKFFLRKLSEHSYEGILFIDVLALGKNKAAFLEITIQALELIACHDPRRFRRLKKEVKYIICSRPHGARMIYSRPWRLCRVDFQQYTFNSPTNDVVLEYAVDLIHEATHGYLFSKRISYTESLQSQVEKICVKEGERFSHILRSHACRL